MERKGYLLRDGRVTYQASGDTIAELGLRTVRYNLRRVFVTKTWVAKMNDGTQLTGALRRTVIDAALRHETRN